MTAIRTWLDRGDFRPEDLAIYRVLFALSMLVNLPSFSWIASYPGVLFDPPPGPLAGLDGFPPAWFFTVLDHVLAGSIVAILLGYSTTVASVLFTMSALLGFGFMYSLGRIDHNILLVIAPLPLAWARWGDRWSMDSLRRHPARVVRQRQWPLRLFAAMCAAALFTAAAPKIVNGWLSPDSQASRGYQMIEYYSNDRTAGLAPFFVGMDNRFLWEMADWATVGVELLPIITFLWWRAWRINLALLALFHVGVLLTLNIRFWPNIIAYGAFVTWSRVVPAQWVAIVGGRMSRVSRLIAGAREARVLGAAVVVLGTVAVRAVVDSQGNGRVWFGPTLIALGAAVATVFLVVVSRRLVTRAR